MIESVQKQLEQQLDILEIDSTHSWDDIEKQYRQLIQRWHPDRNSGENREIAQSKFIEINTAYKAIREHYRKNGAIPRRMPSEQQGPLLGTKKEVVTKPALYKNKLVITAAFGLALLFAFGVVLWSLEARLAENNRDRANIEKSSNANEAAALLREQKNEHKESMEQTAISLEP